MSDREAPAEARVPTCLTCGYSLEGLPLEGICPECARPVATSVHTSLPMLGDREAKRLYQGLRYVVRSVVWVSGGVIGAMLGGAGEFVPLVFGGAVGVLVGGALWVIGWTMVARVRTLRDPEPFPAARLGLLVAAPAQAAACLVWAAREVFGTRVLGGVGGGSLLLLAVGVTVVLGAKCLDSLADASHDEELRGSGETARAMLFPAAALSLIAAVAALAGAGPVASVCAVLALLFFLPGVAALWYFAACVCGAAKKRLESSEQR